MEARTPPHSLEAEKSVLGSMLISRDAAELSAEMLTVQDFYMPQHQYIFEAMCDLVNHAKAVDSVTIVDALERAGKLAAAGGIGYIAELSLFVPSAANVSYYIKIVEDRSVLRQLIAAGGEIINRQRFRRPHNRYIGRSRTARIQYIHEKERGHNGARGQKRAGSVYAHRRAYENQGRNKRRADGV